MRTASSQYRIANWVVPILLAIFLTSAASFTVVRAVSLLGQLSSLATQRRTAFLHSSQIQP